MYIILYWVFFRWLDGVGPHHKSILYLYEDYLKRLVKSNKSALYTKKGYVWTSRKLKWMSFYEENVYTYSIYNNILANCC